MRLFATAAKGTEPALRDELRELGMRGVRADRGGVHCEGDAIDAGRACLWSRVAARILIEVVTFESPDAEALYEEVRAIDWTQWLTPRTTLAVRATCRSSRLTHSQYIAQKTKDAIVDDVRDRLGSRPSVDRDDPDVGVAVHLARDRATVYLDAGGASLHERGWRAQAGAAPLRENLAAAVVRLSGWDRERPFLDPMCGAGTIAIEAAAWARRIAPGLHRRRFGLERWADHDASAQKAMRGLRDQAREAPLHDDGPQVCARDLDEAALVRTRENARGAGVDLVIERGDARRIDPLVPVGTVVTNPPYGNRLEADRDLYVDLARSFGALNGHAIALLALPAATPALERAMGRPTRWWALFNGPIACRLLVYSMP